MIKDPKHIVVSRTDSIGDVSLTLPLCGILKEAYPDARIIFLGQPYTDPIIRCCPHIDEVWRWSELESKDDKQLAFWFQEHQVDTFIHVFPNKRLAKVVKMAQIKNRIGTSHRLYHRFTCNYRPNFTRKRSDLHESQLNTKLLEPFGLSREYSLDELHQYSAFKPKAEMTSDIQNLLDESKKTVILHPKSQGSAVEWPIENFISLAKELDARRYQIIFTGTEKEGSYFKDLIPSEPHIHDLSGKTSLNELIALINQSDSLIAASTGPLHIAGLCGIQAIGLFSTIRPIHSGRWKPLGNKSLVIEDKKNTSSPQPLEIDYRDVLQEVERSS